MLVLVPISAPSPTQKSSSSSPEVETDQTSQVQPEPAPGYLSCCWVLKLPGLLPLLLLLALCVSQVAWCVA